MEQVHAADGKDDRHTVLNFKSFARSAGINLKYPVAAAAPTDDAVYPAVVGSEEGVLE